MAKAFARGRPLAPFGLSAPERAYLERQVRRHRVARSLSERCRVIVRCADGLPSKSVGAELGVHEHTVGKWRRRFLKDRCDGLLDEARPGRPRTIDDDQVAAVIERTFAHHACGCNALVDDDVKSLSEIRAVAPALVKLALRDDRRSRNHKEPPWKRIAKGLG